MALDGLWLSQGLVDNETVQKTPTRGVLFTTLRHWLAAPSILSKVVEFVHADDPTAHVEEYGLPSGAGQRSGK
ncbi:hypothetical protein T265_07000 [Opisthorchis viverrini]|uniref:Uncharacterized protein n=1 Tax=Opisthorchis viverrini TaxID=6198 RepID=A0A074ZE41_OPIVI|nr:hypothetical protein T265_07000 [Opisthorchis viverrini]KER25541.1 hypothetical protein T265_07000 [Opisthorchis viverrini]